MNRREYVTAHQYRYTVLFEPAEEGGYVVTCPSLPGLVTEGDTLQEARANAAARTPTDLRSRLEQASYVPTNTRLRPAARAAPCGLDLRVRPIAVLWQSAQ